MDALPDLSQFDKVGVVGLCVFIVIGFAFEWIVPGRSHRRQIAALQERVAIQDETIQALTTATQNYAVSAHTGSTALRQISKAAEQSKGGDE